MYPFLCLLFILISFSFSEGPLSTFSLWLVLNNLNEMRFGPVFCLFFILESVLLRSLGLQFVSYMENLELLLLQLIFQALLNSETLVTCRWGQVTLSHSTWMLICCWIFLQSFVFDLELFLVLCLQVYQSFSSAIANLFIWSYAFFHLRYCSLDLDHFLICSSLILDVFNLSSNFLNIWKDVPFLWLTDFISFFFFFQILFSSF